MIDKDLKRHAKQAIRRLSKRKWEKFLREYYVRLERADINEKEALEEFFQQTVLRLTEKKPPFLSPDLEDNANRCR